MKLIGAFSGEYEGNKYAKIITLEKFTRSGAFGSNAVISKVNFNYYCNWIDDFELYVDQEVILNYDRFGKVTEIRLAN